MDVMAAADKHAGYLLEMRHYFHAHPELSGKEYNTSKKIKEELDKMGVPWKDCGMETGILAEIKGQKPGKIILLRADMDALPVKELTGFSFASENNGIMHACGHDCHISMLLTAARILQDIKEDLPGTVRLAFQPAEETGEGAKAMIACGALEGVDGFFGMHVWSGIPSGKIYADEGPCMASCDQFIIDVHGKGGHGATPQLCVDAVTVTGAIINSLQTIVSREISPVDPAVVTIGTIKAGDRWNVVAEHSTLEGTTRCFSREVRQQLPKAIQRIAEETGKAYRADVKLTYNFIVGPTINDGSMSELVYGAAAKVVSPAPRYNFGLNMVGEDMAYYLDKVPGAIALLGVGNEKCGAVYPHHSGHFCVDESALIKGAMLYVQTAVDFNGK